MSVPLKKNMRFALLFVVGAAAVAAYSNALQNGITNFDDIWQVGSNPLLAQPLTVGKLARILFLPYHGEYQPVKLLSWLADRLAWGAVGVNFVFGLHLTNCVFHLLNSVLVALMAAAVVSDIGAGEMRENGRLFVAIFAGIYFAVHPIHVESVSWLSSRKDVLSFFFMSLSFLAFRESAVGSPRWGRLLCFVFFLLALASKATVLCLPVIAAVYWGLISWAGGRRIFWLLLALFVVSFSWFVLGLWIIVASGYQAGPAMGSYWLHFLTAVRNFPFYMQKMFFPVRLSAVYPNVAATGLLDPAVLWGAFMIAVQIAVVAFVRVKMVRFIVLWYLLSLLPVLQLTPMAVPSGVADRYAYVPSVAFALAPAIILYQVRAALARRGAVAVASVLVAAGVFYAGILAAATWSRNRVWRSSETLWRDVLSSNPDNPLALVNLGQAYFEAGDVSRSEDCFLKAAQADRGFLLAYLNLGRACQKAGDSRKARDYYLKALLRPSSLTFRYTNEARARAALGLSGIFFQERKFRSARDYAADAIRLYPEVEGAAWAYRQADNAIKESKSLADGLIETADALAASSPSRAPDVYRKAIEAAPEYAAPYIAFARFYRLAGEYQKACDYYAMAFATGKEDPEFEYEYGVVALRAGNYDTAAERLSRALAGDPSMEKAKVKLAIAHAYMGEPAQALRMLKDVLDKDPSNEEAKENYQVIKSLLEKALRESPNAAK